MNFITNLSPITLPDNAAIKGFSCHFQISTRPSLEAERLDIRLPAKLKHAVDKRQSEFIAGRYLANCALLAIGMQEKNEIGIGSHREPIWPEGVTGSISHTTNYAICIAGYASQYRGIGIDTEYCLSSELAEKLASTLANEDEIQILHQQSVSFSVALTLLFSAKESVFKALYSSVCSYFDFSVAALKQIDWITQRWHITLLKSLSPEFPAGFLLSGGFTIENERITTWVGVPRISV